jgi:vancomycin permeability regulator SanA
VIGLARSKPAPQKPEPGQGRARRAARSVGSLRDKRTRRRLYLRLTALATVFFIGYLGITFVQVWWTSRHDGARKADAAVVLGAAQYDGRPSPVLKDRLDHALDLYERDLVKVIVVTGGKQEGDRFTEAFTGYTYLREKGVPESALLTEVQGHNSWESIAATARILRDRGLTDAVMVTDGYHALRVDAIADELGLDASVSPSRPGGSLKELVKETGAVAIGRLVGFRRLVNVDDQIDGRIVSQE